MTLVMVSAREMDLVVDAPFHWNSFLPTHNTLTLHDHAAPVSLYSNNFTELNHDVVDYSSPPNFYFDR